MEKDPSMEDILASIRRIINEDAPPPPALPRAEPEPPADVLDLVEPAPEPARAQPLSGLAVRGYAGADTTLEALVREMLAPLLRDWLDANLPGIVQAAVAREVGRLSRPEQS